MGEVQGADAALALVGALELDDYAVFHVVRAELLRRCGRTTEAISAYDAATARTENVVEREFLVRRRQNLIVG